MRSSRRRSGPALAVAALWCLGLAFTGREAATAPGAGTVARPQRHSLEALLDRARREGWSALPIGERVARFGRALAGTPYVEGTLEGPGPEVCRVTTSGLDCVTFMELCLGLARVTTDGAARPTAADVRDAVTFTRYRGGRLTDYTSRLHYTSEWIADNVAKGVIEDVTAALGGEPCAAPVGFMSKHPEKYPGLAAHPAWVDSMRRIERAINATPRTCIPRGRVRDAEPRLRTGDLVAIATSIAGLDYAHTGMIVRDREGHARLLHASSRHRQVMLDVTLSRYLARGPASFTGVSIARPLEVK